MTTTFKPTWKYLLEEGLGGSLFLAAIVVAMGWTYQTKHDKMAVFTGFVGLILCVGYVIQAIRAAQNFVSVEPRRIFGKHGKERFDWDLASVKYAVITDESLALYQERKMLVIPLKVFDCTALCEAVQKVLPPKIFSEDAYRQFPAFLEQEKRDQLLIASNPRIYAHSRYFLFIGLGFAAFLGCLLFLIDRRTTNWPVTIGLGVFILMGLALATCTSELRVDVSEIRVMNIWGTERISWQEIRSVEAAQGGGALVFVGPNKQLVLMGLSYWSGKDKALLIELVMAQIRTRRLEPKVTRKALFRTSKNTRIRPERN